jgi:hypothetical protein
VFMVDNGPAQNRGLFRIGRDLDAAGVVRVVTLRGSMCRIGFRLKTRERVWRSLMSIVMGSRTS